MSGAAYPRTCVCFLYGFVITAVVALAWPAFALIFSGPLPDAVRWVMHSTTWGFYHLLILPFAVGLFVAAINRDLIRLSFWDEAKRRFYYGLLAVFAVAAVALTYYDANQPGLQPVYLNPDERADAYAFDRKAHESGDLKLAEQRSNVTLEKYIRLVGVDAGSTKTIVNSGNKVAIVSIVLNLLFGLFVAVFFWVLVVSYFGNASVSYDRLLLSFALLGLWFPCRLYASWYFHHLVSNKWLEDYQILWVLILLYLVAAVFFILIHRKDTKRPSQVIALGLLVVPAVLFFVKIVNPEFFGLVARAFENLGLLPSLAIGLVTLMLMAALVHWLLRQPDRAVCSGCLSGRCCQPTPDTAGQDSSPPPASSVAGKDR